MLASASFVLLKVFSLLFYRVGKMQKITEAKRNFATDSDVSVEIKIMNKSKALRDMRTLIGYMTDNFRNNTPVVYQKLFQKVQLRPVTVTVSKSRKFDPPIMSFKICDFATRLKDLYSKQRKNKHY